MASSQQIKQRFGIIGNSPLLDRAIDTAAQVAPTDLSVLITGESGTGKEVMPQIIHQFSSRKHGSYIAVNCGAIPEGTIDSELFGHEKGSFTGALDSRKGYFEVANGGTIFLDEVAELPIQTQVRLLRVLETGEFIKVGSSKVLKTDVRIVAATNVNIPEAIQRNKFREDLYYRLNTVPIVIPPLRERKDDIHLLFRKFASDFAEKYRMPVVRLSEDARQLLINYRWQGNIRQLKNITEQISVIEQVRDINRETLLKYLPDASGSTLPTLYNGPGKKEEFSERDILYKFLFEMKNDLNDLKKLVHDLMRSGKLNLDDAGEESQLVKRLYPEISPVITKDSLVPAPFTEPTIHHHHHEEPLQEPEEVVEESLSLEEKEVELIKKALEKYHGKRKDAAKELGISERTLYRKIKEFHLK
ncbi:MAG: sigma-54 interaction domain-containing protein [Salibacteraceae bacterium]